MSWPPSPEGSLGGSATLRRRLLRVARSAFVKDGALMVVSQALVGFLFLLTHVVLGRRMEEVSYAVVVALLGLLNVLSLPTNTVQIVVTRFVAGFKAASGPGLGAAVVRAVTGGVVHWGLVGLSVWALVAFGGELLFATELIPGASPLALFLVGGLAFLGLFSPILHGALTGEHRFGWLVASSLSGAASRVLLAGLVVSGWLALGPLEGRVVEAVLLAIATSSLLALGVAWWPLRRQTLQERPKGSWTAREIRRYTLPVLFGQGALYLLLNADLILAPRLLAPADLAVYSKGAMLSRAILFLPLPVATAMFPRAVTSSRRRILLAPLGFAAAVSVAAATAVSLFPEVPMELMYGVSDRQHTHIARTYVWAAIPLTLTVLTSHYLWARDRPRVVLGLIPLVGAYLLALGIAPASPIDLALTLGLAATLSFAFLGYRFLKGQSR